MPIYVTKLASVLTEAEQAELEVCLKTWNELERAK